jgi:hypothetical protein
MVYPALKAGRNVDYFSGEMKVKDISALMIVKFLYTEHGIDLSNRKMFRSIGVALQIIAKMQLGITLSPAENAALNKMGNDLFSLVLIAQNELFGVDSKFGKLRVISLTDDAESSKVSQAVTRTQQQFIVENLEHNIMTSIEKRTEETRPDMIVFDHAGHFSSNGKLTQTECFRQVYSIGHKLAGNKLHPFLSVIINHTATEQGEKAAKSNNGFDGGNYRAFGTSEAGKSAEVDISLQSTEEQDKDGRVTLVVNVDRWNDQKQLFKTNAFPLTAKKGTCEFTVVGATKATYATKEELDNEEFQL